VQHAVDAKAYRALLATRLDVDIAGSLLKGVLEQPVDDVDDVRVVGVRFLIAGAEVEKLLEIADAADFLIGTTGAADRLGQAVELDGEALNVARVGHHALDRPLEHVGQVGFPAVHEGLAAGDGDGAAVHRHCEDAVALGEGVGHQWGDGGDVDLQRVDAQIRLTGAFRQPDGQRFQIELLARPLQIIKLLRGEEFQRMLLVGHRAAADRQALFGAVLRDPPLGDQLAQQIGEIERAVLGG